MSETEDMTIGAVSDLISEKTDISNATLENYISTDNMLSNFGGVVNAEKLPNVAKVNAFRKGDILFSNIRTYFKKVWHSSFNGTVSADVLVFRPKDKSVIDDKFLFYLLCNPDFTEYSVLTSRGAKMPRGDKEALKAYDFILPPISEQKAIASVLSSLDDKIDLLHRQNKTLEAMAETLFRQWFVEEAEENWEEGTLDDILTVKGGSTPSTKNPDFWDGEIYWTSPRDITTLNHIHLFETERKITEDGLKKISSGVLPQGTLLMSSRAPVGVLAFAEIPLAINQGYIAILDNKGFSKEFIYFWLKINMDYVHSYANGSTFQEISKSSFKSLNIQLPPEDKRNDFQDFVSPILCKIKANTIQITNIENQRNSLLPKLMSGEVTIKEMG